MGAEISMKQLSVLKRFFFREGNYALKASPEHFCF